MTPLRRGLSLSLSEELAEPAEVARLAAVAEDAGWNGVFVWDHLWNRTGAPFADAWLTLAAVVAATDHVRIGPLVTPLPRRRPQVVAQQATTLDRMSGGRLVLGLGLGTDSYGEFSAFDEPARDDSLRARDLDRGIELLLPALAGAPVPQVGDRRTTVAGTQRPRCPLWVAARPGLAAGPRRLARHGLEGLAMVGVDVWRPEHVVATRAILADAGVEVDAVDLVLVGGDHPHPDELAAAGATWIVREVVPGTTVAEVARTLDGPSGPQSTA